MMFPKMYPKTYFNVNAYIVGEAIRKARLAQNLTQEQLGEHIGVQRAQISKLEKGTSVIYEGTEKVKSTFRLKANDRYVVVLSFFLCQIQPY